MSATKTVQRHLTTIGIATDIRDGELVQMLSTGWKHLAVIVDGRVSVAAINTMLSRRGTGLQRIEVSA